MTNYQPHARTSALFILFAFSSTAYGDLPVMPTDEQVAMAVRGAQQTRQRLDPNYRGLDKVPPFTATIPALPSSPPSASGITLRDMMRQPAPSGMPTTPNSMDVMIFVSLSMPKETLRRLAGQAERAGAVMVLRGLRNNSLRDTVAAVRAISDKPVWQINPPAFVRFRVKTVPTMVLAHQTSEQPADSCAPAGSFVSVIGDVSLDFALESIEHQTPAFRAEAAALLKRMGVK